MKPKWIRFQLNMILEQEYIVLSKRHIRYFLITQRQGDLNQRPSNGMYLITILEVPILSLAAIFRQIM